MIFMVGDRQVVVDRRVLSQGLSTRITGKTLAAIALCPLRCVQPNTTPVQRGQRGGLKRNQPAQVLTVFLPKAPGLDAFLLNIVGGNGFF